MACQDLFSLKNKERMSSDSSFARCFNTEFIVIAFAALICVHRP